MQYHETQQKFKGMVKYRKIQQNLKQIRAETNSYCHYSVNYFCSIKYHSTVKSAQYKMFIFFHVRLHHYVTCEHAHVYFCNVCMHQLLSHEFCSVHAQVISCLFQCRNGELSIQNNYIKR